MKRAVSQSLKSIPIIFVHSKLDDLGLTADEFRVYCHLARRAGNEDVAWPGIESISRICKISHNTVRKSLKSLNSAKLIVVVRIDGATNHYHLTDCEEWDSTGLIREKKGRQICLPLPNEGGVPNGDTPTKVGRGGIPNEGGDPYQSRETKVIQEGNPRRKSSSCAKAPNPDFTRFVKSWEEKYQERLGRPYRFQGGRDAKAVSELLKIPGETCDTLLEVAERAWRKLADEYSPCRHSGTIFDYNHHWQKIKNAVEPPKVLQDYTNPL